MTTKLAAAYLRLSYASAGRPGDASEDTQLEAVRRLCGAAVTIYKDWGVSGRKVDRVEYQRLRTDIEAGKVASVCAYSLSRLGRSTRELLDFVALCRDHGVTLRTSVESLDTSGAMGRLLFTIMAGIAEFEAEVTSERMAGAMAARRAAADAAGQTGPLPNSVPMYGYRHRKALDPDGRRVIVREPDPARPIAPVLDAYREAKSLRGACITLNASGVPSPRGSAWGPSTLARVIQAHDPTLLRPKAATGKRPAGKPARFRGLVVCHCGALLTPNLARKQYRCPRGRDKVGPGHGPATISERRLVDALAGQVERIPQNLILDFEKASGAERERIAEAKRRAGVRYKAGELRDDEYLAEVAALDAKAEAISKESGRFSGVRLERPVRLSGDPGDVNAALRRWWSRVRLDRDQNPTVEWFIDPDELERREAENEAALKAAVRRGEV
jgi:DNA invertase Pin-like site-specific DNA recombinase